MMRLEGTWFVAAFHSTPMHDPGLREVQHPARVCVWKGASVLPCLLSCGEGMSGGKPSELKSGEGKGSGGGMSSSGPSEQKPGGRIGPLAWEGAASRMCEAHVSAYSTAKPFDVARAAPLLPPGDWAVISKDFADSGWTGSERRAAGLSWR